MNTDKSWLATIQPGEKLGYMVRHSYRDNKYGFTTVDSRTKAGNIKLANGDIIDHKTGRTRGGGTTYQPITPQMHAHNEHIDKKTAVQDIIYEADRLIRNRRIHSPEVVNAWYNALLPAIELYSRIKEQAKKE